MAKNDLLIIVFPIKFYTMTFIIKIQLVFKFIYFNLANLLLLYLHSISNLLKLIKTLIMVSLYSIIWI